MSLVMRRRRMKMRIWKIKVRRKIRLMMRMISLKEKSYKILM